MLRDAHEPNVNMQFIYNNFKGAATKEILINKHVWRII